MASDEVLGYDGNPIERLTSNLTGDTESEGDRVYLVAEQPLPSVTTILGRIYGKPFPRQAAAAVEYARQRGTEFHRAAALLTGAEPGLTVDWESLDPEVAVRLGALMRWLEKSDWEPTHIERTFWSDRFAFAGTPDHVGYDEGELTVLDFKPPEAKQAHLQLAGYAIAIKECLDVPYVRRVSLHFDGKGGCRPHLHTEDARDRDVFQCAAVCYHHGVRRRLWL